MATKYYFHVQGVDSEETHVVKMIQVGARTLSFEFQWATASEEQCNMVLRHLVNHANTDPLILPDGSFNRTYNWLEYYINLVGVDLNMWLDTNPILPVSCRNKTRLQQLNILNINIAEAESLSVIVSQYIEVMKWQVTVSSTDTETTSCRVELGGWNRNQDNHYAFRFLSGRDNIGRYDINEVYIEFEVYDE